jgi:hypothetical protein
MSQGTDAHSCGPEPHNHGDSAGVPWEGRSFEQNPHAADDGSADPALLAALLRFRAGEGSQVEVVDAFRSARVLIPLVAEMGDEGVGPTGLAVDKTQELSIVTVAAPDGRRVLPAFTGVEALSAWNPQARPIPVDARRVALAAAGEGTDLVVLDPTSPTEFALRRPALRALATGETWHPAAEDPRVAAAVDRSIADELDVLAARVSPGDPDARLAAPEIVIALAVPHGLPPARVAAVVERLSAGWAADAVLAESADSIAVRIVPVDPDEDL